MKDTMNQVQLSVTHDYDDIIDLPHHVSSVHPRMSEMDRAAQFAPFSALVGLDDAIDEKVKELEEKIAAYEPTV